MNLGTLIRLMRVAFEAVQDLGGVLVRRGAKLGAVLYVAMAEAAVRLQMAAGMVELGVYVLDRKLVPIREDNWRGADRRRHLQILVLRILVASTRSASAPGQYHASVSTVSRWRIDLVTRLAGHFFQERIALAHQIEMGLVRESLLEEVFRAARQLHWFLMLADIDDRRMLMAIDAIRARGSR